MMLNLTADPALRVACKYLISKHAGWAGSGFGGTLLPPTMQAGGGAKASEPLHGWDRYVELVALDYKAAPASTGQGKAAYIALKQHILNMFTRLQSKVQVRFVDYDPYQSAEEMQQKVNETGVLEISKEFNQSEAFGPEVNLMLRAVHDFAAHLGANPANKPRSFTLKGEMQAYNKHLALIGTQSHAVGALFTEIVAQVCYFWYFGGFPTQKVITLPRFDWKKLGAVQGYRIINGDLVR